MFNVLVDTCVWLDLAQDPKQIPSLDSLEMLVSRGKVKLLVPRIVLTEFQRNRLKIVDRAQRSLSGHFNSVKDAIRKVEGDTKRKNKMIEYLADMDHRIPLVGGAATATLNRIEKLIETVLPIETTDAVKVRAADRAIARLAPCHHDTKNAIADATLIETYFTCVKEGSAGDRFAFITHNKHDFSDMHKNQRSAHPDLAAGFSKIKSLYLVSLSDFIHRIDPALMQEVVWESQYEQPVRGLTEILKDLETLTTQVWYNRHKNLVWRVEHGKHKIVSRSEWDANWQTKKQYGQAHTIDVVWRGALKAATKAEKKLGKGNYGPWTDFEWGMINGKLSALRWALGDDWDMLDT